MTTIEALLLNSIMSPLRYNIRNLLLLPVEFLMIRSILISIFIAVIYRYIVMLRFSSPQTLFCIARLVKRPIDSRLAVTKKSRAKQLIFLSRHGLCLVYLFTLSPERDLYSQATISQMPPCQSHAIAILRSFEFS